VTDQAKLICKKLVDGDRRTLDVKRFEWQVRQFDAPGIRKRFERVANPCRTKFRSRVAKRVGPCVQRKLRLHRDNTSCIHGKHGSLRRPCECPLPLTQWSHGHLLDNDNCCSIRQSSQRILLDDFRALVLLQIERVGDPAFRQLLLNVSSAFHDEGMMAIRRVWVLLGKTVVDKHWKLEMFRQRDRRFQSRVLVSSNGGAHPVEYKFSS